MRTNKFGKLNIQNVVLYINNVQSKHEIRETILFIVSKRIKDFRRNKRSISVVC